MFYLFSIKGGNISQKFKMQFILVSAEDPSVEKTVEIPKEIINDKTSIQDELTESIKPPEPQTHKKSRQTSKSIIHG